MSKKLVSDLIVDYLERRNVTKLFGLCGHTVIGMLDALSRSKKIEYIGMRHEAIASTAADGYARITHKAAVVMCHLGPGLTNVITGVANASLDSIPMVVIAGICGLSTGKLFLGGIVPGIMCGVAQMIVSYFLAKKEGVAREPGHFSFGPVLKGLWESWPALLMPIIIVGTIMSGIVSPTEAGVIAVVYGLFAGGVIYRELKWEDIKFAFAETVRVSGRIFIVIGAAKLYTVMLTTAGFDKWMAKTMLGISTTPTVILVMILLLFFIVTMFMESIATLTLFMPILYPIATSVGIDPIVMSVLITVVIGIGLVTPPVGMCIYVACDLMDIKVYVDTDADIRLARRILRDVCERGRTM